MRIKIPCVDCKGTGVDIAPHPPADNQPAPPPGTCVTCGGEGYIYHEATTEEIDEISAYLVTLRADLTTALTAIWNKVKNLP